MPKSVATSLAVAISVVIQTSVALAQIVRPMPVVERLEPTSGPPGTSVVLNGRHFDDAQTLWLGGSQLEVTSRHPNRWTVRIPEGAPSATLEVRTQQAITEKLSYVKG